MKTIGTQAFFACDRLQAVTIPASVDTIGAAVFSGCKSMTELTIEGAPVIGEYAFARLSGLTTVRVNSMTPPKASVSSFYGIAPGSVSLVVPKGSEKAYMKAAG